MSRDVTIPVNRPPNLPFSVIGMPVKPFFFFASSTSATQFVGPYFRVTQRKVEKPSSNHLLFDQNQLHSIRLIENFEAPTQVLAGRLNAKQKHKHNDT